MKADLPPNEPERLKALQSYEILDTTTEREFDDITLLASQICGTPIAMISLVDENRQWFKSKVGMTETETSRDIAFCAHGILQADVFTVEDALLDERFASNPLVTDGPRIRFYAGAPLISPDGHALGMLCVNDQKPRALTAEQKAALQALSRQVVTQLELRRTISDLKQKDQALRTSEERFCELADNVTDVFWMTSPDLSEILYINPAYEKIWGRSMASLYADPHQWISAILPEDRGRVVAAFSALGVDKLNVEAEYRITRPDGSIRWIQDRGFQIRDPSGKVLRTTGIAQDITESKQAEEQLRWKTALLEAQINSTLDGILIVDQDRKTILQNQRFVDMLKMPPDIADDESDHKRLQWAAETFKNPESVGQRISYLYVHPKEISRDELEFKNGMHLDRYSAPVVGQDGKSYGRIWIFRDITEPKRAETALRQSEERYRSLINNARDAVFTIAVDGTFTSLNPAVEAISGILRADWIGRSFEPMVHPDDLPLAREMFRRVLQAEPAPVHELRGHPSLKRPALMEMTLTPQLDEHGKIIGVLGIGRDITDRKRIETQLFQSQKLETIGKLAGGIAHEFNSILTAIIGQCELLLSDLPPGSRMAKSATEISQATSRAATLTRQLLAYGRKQMLQLETLDLNRVVAGMESIFRLLMGGDVAVQIVPAADLRTVKADAGQIEQVIMNIVINARDAMPNGGKLTLETANVSFDEESVGRYPELKAGDYVMLAMSDTGAGMSEQVKARLFEPFFTTKAVGNGTGLGLSTCYGIIKQSGGHISVYSEPGRGATFKIYLPQAEQKPQAPVERVALPALARGTETILLVEDDSALREMASTLLTRLGYKVWAAANGVEALSLKQQKNVGHIDLLFTDVVMPHMSGKELADRVRSLYPHTRILFTTAYTENASIHQGVLDKGEALLQKPFTPSALAQKVREILDDLR